jgi:8-oxo-dGTP pyrophosphatase MutT (NUDIX family)
MTNSISYDFTHNSVLSDFTVTTAEYLKARPDAAFSLLATGVLVFDTTTASQPRVLLLQRAAHDSNPNKWEPPGGACDDEDASILHGAARELWEETGLQAKKFVGAVGEPYVFSLRSGRVVSRFYF